MSNDTVNLHCHSTARCFRAALCLLALGAPSGLVGQTPKQQPMFQAVVTSEPAEGISEAQMDMDFLKIVEAWVIERQQVNTAKARKANGLPDSLPASITAESGYLFVGDKKLLVIRTMTDGIASVIVGAFFGNDFKKVSCVAETDDKIPITFGPCADAIEEAFGFRIGIE